MDNFSRRQLAFCTPVENQLRNDLLCLPAMQNLLCGPLSVLFNHYEIAYPRLVRLFYLNLRAHTVDGLLQLKSIVLGKEVVLSHEFLSEAIGCSSSVILGDSPGLSKIMDIAQQKYFRVSVTNTKKQLTQSVLKLEPRLVFYLLQRCVVPKCHSRELLTIRSLELMHKIISDQRLDVPNLIMRHMLYCTDKSGSRKHPLPYANLLSNVFQLMDINLEFEEVQRQGFGLITEEGLQSLGVVKVKKGLWKLIPDLTEEEKHAKPNLKYKEPTVLAAPALPDDFGSRLSCLEATISEMKDNIIDIQMDLRSFNSLTVKRLELINQNIMNLAALIPGIEVTTKHSNVSELHTRQSLESNSHSLSSLDAQKSKPATVPANDEEIEDSDSLEVSLKSGKVAATASVHTATADCSKPDVVVPAVSSEDVPTAKANAVPETETNVDQVPEAFTETVPQSAAKENAAVQAAAPEADKLTAIVAEHTEFSAAKVPADAKTAATEDAAEVAFAKTVLEEPDTEENMSLSALKKKKFAKNAAGSSKRKSRAVKPKKSRRVVTRRVVKAKLVDTDEDDSNAEVDY